MESKCQKLLLKEIVLLFLGSLFHITTLFSTSAHEIEEPKSMWSNESYASFTDRLFQHYDASHGPGDIARNRSQVVVSVSLHISSFSGVSVEKMELIISVYITQRWNDPRLLYIEGPDEVAIYGKNTEKIWTPDTYFPQEKEGGQYDITKLNAFARISSDGTVYYNQRIRLVISCLLHLHWFPLDSQTCPLKVESYGHPARLLQLHWAKDEPVTFEDGSMQSPEFGTPNITISEVNVTYGGTKEVYSSLRVVFYMKRHIVFYLMETYMPFISIVVVSWSSCWISVHGVPARASIGVVTVLSIVVHNEGIQRRMPHVSYMKAVDLYMIVCLVFVMLALVEFCAAHIIAQRANNARNPSDSFKSLMSAERLDVVSRVMFPALFLTFNVCYWAVLITRPIRPTALTDLSLLP